MRLILMQFVTVDGVCQGPGAPDEDVSDGFTHGGWLVPFIDERFIDVVRDWTTRADAFLFGRRTYEAFALAWPAMDDPDDPVASALNGRPKYVATRTLTTTTWQPATILDGDLTAQVGGLKAQPGRELQVHGSASLGWWLLDAGLVDELRLVVAPVILGDGHRLLPAGTAATGLRLLRHEQTPAGLGLHVYETAGEPSFGTYGAGGDGAAVDGDR
jgi:dihydrofolate reductase